MPVYQKAFVLIKVASGHAEDVMATIMKVPEITEAHIIPGDWDIIAVISIQKEVVVPSDEKIYRLVLDKIEKLKHVQDTSTMVSQFSRTK